MTSSASLSSMAKPTNRRRASSSSHGVAAVASSASVSSSSSLSNANANRQRAASHSNVGKSNDNNQSDHSHASNANTNVSANVSASAISSKSSGASKDSVVQSLFGSIVGSCLAEYSCTYHRQSARLYVTTKKLLLYSNILGFERRLCVDWNEVDVLELTRTTSIAVSTIDGEEYIFRSLEDRQKTLALMRSVKAEEDRRFEQILRGNRITAVPPSRMTITAAPAAVVTSPLLPQRASFTTVPTKRLSSSSTASAAAAAAAAAAATATAVTVALPSADQAPLRRRSQSVPTVVAPLPPLVPKAIPIQHSISSSGIASVVPENSVPPSIVEPMDLQPTPPPPPSELARLKEHPDSTDEMVGNRSPLTSSDHSVTSAPSAKATPSIEEVWRLAKSNAESSYRDTPTPKVLANCPSLKHFHEYFLADDAPFSIPKFQVDVVRDSELQVEPWKAEETSAKTEETNEGTVPTSINDASDASDGETAGPIETFRRTISFRHPISVTFGPSSALARREQRLSRYGDRGMILEISTFTQGVPAASDCMYVDDKWILEPTATASTEAGSAAGKGGEEDRDDMGRNDGMSHPHLPPETASRRSQRGRRTGITMTVWHQTRFTKRTMLKKVIQASTRTEVTGWYQKYFQYIESALEVPVASEDGDDAGRKSTATTVVSADSPCTIRQRGSTGSLLENAAQTSPEPKTQQPPPASPFLEARLDRLALQLTVVLRWLYISCLSIVVCCAMMVFQHYQIEQRVRQAPVCQQPPSDERFIALETRLNSMQRQVGLALQTCSGERDGPRLPHEALPRRDGGLESDLDSDLSPDEAVVRVASDGHQEQYHPKHRLPDAERRDRKLR